MGLMTKHLLCHANMVRRTKKAQVIWRTSAAVGKRNDVIVFQKFYRAASRHCAAHCSWS